ncbi:hypothetical protein E6C67_30955 [Azospirillum sp. TSA2s]|uniref:tyrosine-type recombinase/integrase n=1 Tax=Azospirillum sp. TSA2s TaxID=709810 RepID=UPI0010AA4C54|nr:tyrosine-type recombinase/integrase [Azospirillum sp. TSA2s]QCG98112.1 hypothetical protein E6C67_30955 [Azospirillum sp. TSA2s]
MQPRTRWVISTDNLNDLNTGLQPEPRPGVPLLLVDDVAEPVVCFWMMALAQRHSPDTVETYSRAIEAWWRMLLLRKLRWWEITSVEFQAWTQKLRQDGLKTSSLHTLGAAVCSFYKWAHASGYIDRVPFRISDGRWKSKGGRGAAAAEPPKVDLGTVRLEKPRIVTAEQFDRILANIPHRDPGLVRRDELMAQCGKWVGLRRMEVVGIKVSQLRGVMEVSLGPNAPIPFFALELDPESTKGKKGGLVLVIPMLVKKFRDYIAPGGYRDQIVERARQRAKRSGENYVEPDEVFLTDRGAPFKRETLSSYYRLSARKAQVDSRFHRLRHTAATNVAQVTFDRGSKGYQVVQNLLRHSDEKTSRIYIDQVATQSEMYQSLMSLNDLAIMEERWKAG